MNLRLKTLAIDPASKCGWAHSTGPSGVWDLSIRRDESAGMRLIRFRGKLNEILNNVGVNFVIYEAARHSAPKMQGALTMQAMLQGVLIEWCEDHRCDYRGYSPAEIKKHATGRGNANKAQMLAAARDAWPDIKIIDDNQADALWLLDLAHSQYAEGFTSSFSL